jgi:hypothetical protein
MTDVLSADNPWSHSTMLDPSRKSTAGRIVRRRIIFFRNGDRYFPGKQINLIPQDYLTLRHFLQELSMMIDLPYGIRRLFTARTGSEVTDLNLLKDGGSYVCASFEPFQKLDYTTSTNSRATVNHQTCKDAFIAFSLLPFIYLSPKQSFLFRSFPQL